MTNTWVWINENNVLYFIPMQPDEQMIPRLNRTLWEWAYPFYLTFSQFRNLDIEQIWVEPNAVEEENWPDQAVSKQPVDGWVEVRFIDLESLEREDVTYFE